MLEMIIFKRFLTQSEFFTAILIWSLPKCNVVQAHVILCPYLVKIFLLFYIIHVLFLADRTLTLGHAMLTPCFSSFLCFFCSSQVNFPSLTTSCDEHNHLASSALFSFVKPFQITQKDCLTFNCNTNSI